MVFSRARFGGGNSEKPVDMVAQGALKFKEYISISLYLIILL
jgi:hypothetical protein